MTSIAELLARARPAETKLRLNLDGALAGRIDDLTYRIKAARKRELLEGPGLASDAAGLADQLALLEAEQEAGATEFLFRALNGEEFDELMRTYPPTSDQLSKYHDQIKQSPIVASFVAAPEYDSAGLAPALVAASLAEVDGEPVSWSVQDGQALWKKLHDGARADLLKAAWDVNQRRSVRPTYGNGTAATPSSVPDSTMQPDWASLSQSLTDGL